MRFLLCCLIILLSCLSYTSFAQTAPAQRIPDPVLRFGNIMGKAASVEELLARPELILETPAQPQMSSYFRVISFALGVVHGGVFEELPVVAPNVPTRDTVVMEDPVTGDVTVRVMNNANKSPGNTVNGSLLTPHQVSRLKTLVSGDKVFFDNIRATVPDGSTRFLGSLELLIR